LSRIERSAFLRTGLIEIIIPASVEVLGAGCFSKCRSLSSVQIEAGSRLPPNQEKALRGSWIVHRESAQGSERPSIDYDSE
jgi:hypothetical protein